jgi:putative ABC transport system ATP-binding protein
MMNRVAVCVSGIGKSYKSGVGATWALRDVDAEFRRGELVLLMGPSGSGKTTLLSIMGCIIRPTCGYVSIDGVDITREPEDRLPGIRLNKIGFVFQGFNLFPALTAAENIGLALHVKGIRGSRARARAAALLESVGLTDRAKYLPADLSGGQKQRIAIARALALDPGIILADEPTAALDSESGTGVVNMLRELAHERDRAVIIVTHDSRMERYADRIVHLQDGRMTGQAGFNPAARERLSIPQEQGVLSDA